jgi:hypothetical protein
VLLAALLFQKASMPTTGLHPERFTAYRVVTRITAISLLLHGTKMNLNNYAGNHSKMFLIGAACRQYLFFASTNSLKTPPARHCIIWILCLFVLMVPRINPFQQPNKNQFLAN